MQLSHENTHTKSRTHTRRVSLTNSSASTIGIHIHPRWTLFQFHDSIKHTHADTRIYIYTHTLTHTHSLSYTHKLIHIHTGQMCA